MIAFTIEVRPDRSALAVGGWSAPSRGGDKATARDEGGLVLPASTLRGALRIELERLLAGDGQRACSANRAEPTDPAQPCDCPVCRLFGEAGGATGTLRLTDAFLAGDVGSATLIRSTIAVSRRTGTVVTGHLGFAETSDLLGDEPDQVFKSRGFLVPLSAEYSDETLAQDLKRLEGACAALSALGGGKARGLGWVTCTLVRDQPTEEPPETATGKGDLQTCEVRFAALAPLHFGQGRPIAFFHPSTLYAPGSTVRGALAWGLLDAGLAKPDDSGFQGLFGPGSEVSFGSARPAGFAPCATRRKCRPNEHVFDDLVSEILRRKAAEQGVGLAVRTMCPRCGEATKLLDEDWSAPALPRPRSRVRTRTALNRKTGTSMDQKLFSVEVVEREAVAPGKAGSKERRSQLVLTAHLSGLPPQAASLLTALASREIWLGGKRSQGLGRCLVTIDRAQAASASGAMKAIEALGSKLNLGWQAVESAADKSLAPILREDELPLALVLEEPWCSPEGEPALRQGPLPQAEVGEPLARFLELSEEGRFGGVEARRYGAPDLAGEKLPVPAVAPGSIFVYSVARERVVANLESWLALGESGTGLHRELGWGRFRVWESESLHSEG